MMHTRAAKLSRRGEQSRSGERGWALLGLLLALGVMSIVLVSSIVPNVQMEVQRDKEAEMVYRGEQMALGIARYYGRGNLVPLQLLVQPTPLPYLTELNKLRDGVNIGVREIRFVRPSAMIDPMTSSEWEPIRARDPRIMRFLQAWAAETLIPIPAQYLLIAGPPQTSVFKDSSSSTQNQPQGGSSQTPPAEGAPSSTTPQARPGQAQTDPADKDPDDDDPLAHLFGDDEPGHSNAPIVGVAPKKKGTALRAYYGLDRYEDWVFIYIPKNLPQQQRFNTWGGAPLR